MRLKIIAVLIAVASVLAIVAQVNTKDTNLNVVEMFDAKSNSTANEETFLLNETGNEVSTTIDATVGKKKITKLNIDSSRVLLLLGPVGNNAIELIDKLRALNGVSSEPIYLILNTPGGSVVTGSLLISAMQASKAPVYTICYSLCASMGAMIHGFGKERLQMDRSILMFHPATAGSDGEVDKMYSFVGFLKKYCDKLLFEIAQRSKINFDRLKLLASNELWLDAEDAVKMNITDKIVSINDTNITALIENQISEIEEKNKNKKAPNKPSAEPKRDMIWIMPGVNL